MPQTDPSHNLFSSRAALDALFAPRSVAVIGASETPGSVGRALLSNLVSSRFQGTVYPVNPRRQRVLGQRAFPRIGDVPEPVDLAVIAVPAVTVGAVMAECADHGVASAVVVSAGFRESGEAGAAREREVMRIARGSGMRILGPNSLGVVRPNNHFNASFLRTEVLTGRVALLSQSGALLSAVIDWGTQQRVGFSAAVSLGSMADVGWGEAIEYFGTDPHTQSILLYMESVGEARSFLSAAREVALSKPILVLRAGRTERTARAAASHTGALVGSDRVLDAALRRSGMLRVETIAELFHTAETLAKQARPAGPKLAIVTNAGGPALLAADALLSAGGTLAEISHESRALITAPDDSPRAENPIDLSHHATATRFAEAVDVLQTDPEVDGVLIIHAPQPGIDPAEVASAVVNSHRRKPLLASWMGGASVVQADEVLNRANIPTFPFPDAAASVFAAMWRYAYNLRGLYETPTLPTDQPGLPDRSAVQEIVDRERKNRLLPEIEAKALLAAYGIAAVETRVAKSPEEAVAAANEIGLPVVVKLHSSAITHKSDVGGVKLGLRTASSVADAYHEIRDALVTRGLEDGFDGVSVQPMIERYGVEVIAGMFIDPAFGPVLLFGAGGRLAEVHRDTAIGLPPLNSTLARRMMEQTHVSAAFADDPDTLAALEELLVRFSHLVVEQPRIAEIEINPLLVTSEGLVALDARARLHPLEIPEEALPRPAIRPYPQGYVEQVVLDDGSRAVIRPIRPEDEPLLVRFHQELGEESVYMRYASSLKLEGRVAHDRLARRCFIDYDREMALVVETVGADGTPMLLGIGRLTKLPAGRDAEFAILVTDGVQGKGIGTLLLERLVRHGRREGMERIVADILARNRPMQRVAEKLGFAIIRPGDFSDPMVQAVKVL